MRLVLVRHGDAHAGFHGVIGGVRGCSGLTDLGRRQAAVLRDHLAETRRLRPDALVSSTLPRAIETAAIIAPGLGGLDSRQEADLCEVDPGEADGLTWLEYERRHGRFDMETDPDRVFAPAGDSWNSFHARVRGMLDRLVAAHPDDTVVAVCHAGVIMASMRLLLGMSGATTQLRPTNTGLTEWTFDGEQRRWTLHTFNDHAHLWGLDGDENG